MDQRARELDQLRGGVFDVLVIGAGINGAVATLALSKRGANVACVTRDDLGAGTSQGTSNMVWGGFKYLEGYEISLVAGLCRSRNRLAQAFPSRLIETRFLATLDRNAPYSPWFATLGAIAYWGLGRFFTRLPRHRSASWIGRVEPAVRTTTARGGIEYSDYLILDNDARFVSMFMMDAARSGATIGNYVELVDAVRVSGRWRITLLDTQTGEKLTCSASVLVNAAGPGAPDVGRTTRSEVSKTIVLSKGIHLVVPQLTTSRRVLAFYDDSRRLFYVLPMGHRSVIGTTDTVATDVGDGVTDTERHYLLDQVSKRLDLADPLSMADIIAERVGVRPLVVEDAESIDEGDWMSLSRQHSIEIDAERRAISILGGKLSDCVNVGSDVVGSAKELGLKLNAAVEDDWFGEPSEQVRDEFLRMAHAAGLDWEPRFESEQTYAAVLWRRHGSAAFAVLARVDANTVCGGSMMDLGDYSEAEVAHIGETEWVVSVDDFLRRRTLLAQLNRPAALREDAGVRRAAELLFGSKGLADLDS